MARQQQSKKMYEHVMEKVYDDVHKGRLKMGDKLPSERQLNELLGISRASVREGLRALESIGIISSQQGEGNFINGDFTDALLKPAAALFILNGGTKRNAIDMRMNLECLSVRTAANNISPHELDDLEEILNQMRKSKDPQEELELDRQFHRLISDATGNILLVTLLQIVNYVTNLILTNDRHDYVMTPELIMKVEMAHHNLVIALRERNPNKAEHVMRQHLRQVFSYALGTDLVITESQAFEFDAMDE